MACSWPTSLVLPSPQGWLVATSQLSSGWWRSGGFPEDFILINLIEISSWVKERNSRQSPAEAVMAGQAQHSSLCLVLLEAWGSCPGAMGSWSCCSGEVCRASERIKMGPRNETAVHSRIVCFGIVLSFCKSAEEGWCIGVAHCRVGMLFFGGVIWLDLLICFSPVLFHPISWASGFLSEPYLQQCLPAAVSWDCTSHQREKLYRSGQIRGRLEVHRYTEDLSNIFACKSPGLSATGLA